MSFWIASPSIRTAALPVQADRSLDESKEESCGCLEKTNFWSRLFKESYSATLMVIRKPVVKISQFVEWSYRK